MDAKVFLGKYRISADEIYSTEEITDSSVTYHAKEIDSGRNVVVEAVSTQNLDAAALERLAAEAIAAKKLNHVNIPELCDFGVDGDHFVYVTEDFEGTLAEDWVNASGPLPAGPALRVASQVVSALSAAAVQHIVHPAINPSTLLLAPGQTEDGEWPLVKVLRFVAAAPKLLGNSLAVAAFDKSLHYVSPEQIKTGAVDFRSEIYSLGCTMWFLLTGSPPLVTPKGPGALASTGKSKAREIPRTVKRLLAQMLSTNPEARPRDPIAFYRKLQECLVQVDQQENLSQRFGIPLFFRARAGDWLVARRSVMKTLALAALFLTFATVAALVVPGYLRYRRIVREQEPPGKLIGVPDTVAKATPVDGTANPMASTPASETGSVAQLNNSPPATVEKEAVKANVLPATTNSPESADRNHIIEPPRQATADLSLHSQEPGPAAVTANNAAMPTATVPSATTYAALAAAQPPAPSPEAVAQPTASERIALNEVRRTEPAEPEVRRAEPAPPGEGAEASAQETTVPPRPPTNTAAQIENNRDVESKTASDTSRTAKPSNSKSKSTAKARVRNQRPANLKRRFPERIYLPEGPPEFADALPPAPRRSVRARWVGVAPDGRWVLKLPSNEIVLVPPPRRRR